MPVNREAARQSSGKQLGGAARTERSTQASGAAAPLAALQRAARGMRGMTPQDVMQLQRAVGNRAVRQMMAKTRESASGSGVIQRSGNGTDDKRDVFDLRGEKTSEQKYPSDDYEDAPGFSYLDVKNKFTGVTADKGLPTYYKVLKTVYGEDNLNKDFFESTKTLDEQGGADRAREVTAELVTTRNGDERPGNAMVTAIGHLGNQETLIRGGDGPVEEYMPPPSPLIHMEDDEEETPPHQEEEKSVDEPVAEERPLATSYQGGHLVGWKIFGPGADQEWNVAPMDAKNNEQAYNNTIENMLREGEKGTQFTYTVKVQYETDNFRVDQHQLKKHNVLNKLVKGKPWAITLPSRIPRHWEAKAVKSTGTFGIPTNEESKKKEKATASTYEQYSQGMDESKLRRGIASHTARYNLTFNDDRKIKVKDVRKNPGVVKTAHYRMHQVLPDDRDMGIATPEYAPEESFGSVKVNEVTVQDVEKLKQEIETLLSEVESIPEPVQVDINLQEWMTTELFSLVETAGTSAPKRSGGNKRSKKKGTEQLPPSIFRLARFATLIEQEETKNKLSELDQSITMSRNFDLTMEEDHSAYELVKTSMQTPVFSDLSQVTDQRELQQLHRDLRSHRDLLHNVKSKTNKRKDVSDLTKRKFDEAFDDFKKSSEEARKPIQDEEDQQSFGQQQIHSIFSMYPNELRNVQAGDLVFPLLERLQVQTYRTPFMTKKLKTQHNSGTDSSNTTQEEK